MPFLLVSQLFLRVRRPEQQGAAEPSDPAPIRRAESAGVPRWCVDAASAL